MCQLTIGVTVQMVECCQGNLHQLCPDLGTAWTFVFHMGWWELATAIGMECGTCRNQPGPPNVADK